MLRTLNDGCAHQFVIRCFVAFCSTLCYKYCFVMSIVGLICGVTDSEGLDALHGLAFSLLRRT